MAAQRGEFKNKDLFQGDTARTRRLLNRIEIDRQLREKNLFKRRNFYRKDLDSDDEMEDLYDMDAQNNQHIQELAVVMASDQENVQCQATTAFREMLCKQVNPPIDQAIQAGVVPTLVQFLTAQHDRLPVEAAWTLSIIASGTSEQTKIVVENGAVPILVQLLSSNVPRIQEQALCVLGNIAGDSIHLRNYLLTQGIVTPLLAMLKQSHTLNVMRHFAWTLSNLCRDPINPEQWNILHPVLPALAKMINCGDDDALIFVCSAMARLASGSPERTQAVLDAGVTRRLVCLLSNSSTQVRYFLLRLFGSIVQGDDLQTQAALNCNILSSLSLLLKEPSYQRQICCMLSNITAGNNHQIQMVIDSNILPMVIHLLAHGAPEIRAEACWVFVNAIRGALKQPKQAVHLVAQGCIKPLCDLLVTADNNTVFVALEGIDNILLVGDFVTLHHPHEPNPCALVIEEARGIHAIEHLQNHENAEISSKASAIINDYFTNDHLLGA